MIDTLLAYARDHRLVAEPGFMAKPVLWSIDVAPDGTYSGVLPLGDTTNAKNKGRVFDCCPDLSHPELLATKGSHFLAETAQVVTLLGLEGASKPAQEKAARKHEFFVNLLRQAARDIATFEPLASALSSEEVLARIREDLTRLRAKPNDRVTLSVAGSFPLEQTDWHAWWRNWRAANLSRGTLSGLSPRMVSFVTGAIVEPTPTHPKIMGLADVGGNSSGASLVSFDKAAFTSYGLTQSSNAAMSDLEASGYRAALNALIASHGRRLAANKVVYWFSRYLPDEDDPFPDLFEGASDDAGGEGRAMLRARKLLDSVRTGQRSELLDAQYYAVSLSGSGGRIMIRDCISGSFEELLVCTSAWFTDLEIVRRDGSGMAHPPKFLAVVGALVRDLADVPPHLVTRLWRSALRREPIPYHAMAMALARTRADVLVGNPPNHARMGLLKAYYLRRGDQQMSASVNEAHPEPAYHCGRLLALYASLQRLALPNVDSGVIQRFYAAASTTPALVLGRIARTSQFHLSTVRADRPGLAYWYETQIAAVWAAIGDRLPAVLTLEQQGLFALGYYHQLADRRSRPEDPDSKTTTQEGEDND